MKPSVNIAIMQPTYLPWLGYFGLMKSVNKFVILDNVQFSKRSWQQRNRIKTRNGESWLTVPVKNSGIREQLIYEVEIDYSNKFPINHIKSIQQNYSKHKFYCEYKEELACIYNANYKYLIDLNMALINFFRKILFIDCEIIYSSTLGCEGRNADLLAKICKKLLATKYISPPGSKDYLSKSNSFELAGIPVEYFQYSHPQYSQLYEDFIPYLSTLDLIFNCGIDSANIIEN
ncbi:WbqC family protein [Polynucleobacter sp. es-GGE-1]|uniref:WbqC family protein n=1 Tax=Polynucleobacter sp. es-GGE-1 TaxID=1819724 RepID=UPI001C0E0AE2|nr:WbqC family protein [Polynucleobacter sp. es-GGE-1]MBU3635539.1 WbqC family protein [Polynucleobacter sp. es-GGE-1]